MSSTFIPKIIYQTFESWDTVPDEFKKRISIFRKINSNYEYKFYSNEDCEAYIKNVYGKTIFNIYNSLSPEYAAARADLFRYLLIYDKGGVYFDIKSYPIQPLDKILSEEDEILLSCWHSPNQEHILKTGFGEFLNWFVIARPRHPFLKEVILLVFKKILESSPNQYSGKTGVLNLTGPITFTQAIFPILNNYPHTFKKNSFEKTLSYNGAKIPDHPYERFDWHKHTRSFILTGNKPYIQSTADIIIHDKLDRLKNRDVSLNLDFDSFFQFLKL
jgi:inositol phosphorylceramide mannosyltransferase catalytic subunit